MTTAEKKHVKTVLGNMGMWAGTATIIGVGVEEGAKAF